MVTAVAGAGTGFIPPPLKFPVDVKVMSNDPVMRITVSDRTVKIQGVANNQGIVPSFAQFDLGGKKINLQLNGGMTGEQVLAALKKRLPAGFSIQGTASGFRVMQGGAKPSTIEQINRIFLNAREANSPGKGLMTTGELRSAFKVALQSGGKLSAAEKQALAQNWASMFTGAGFLATPAAQKEYARLQKKYDLPVIPVF